MDALINSIKGVAGQNAGKLGQPRIATICSVDPSTYTVRVSVQPEGTLSGWLPVMTLWAGAGWGLLCLPAVGDQVVILPQEGDVEQAIVLGRIWSGKTQPPVSNTGEAWFVHASGSYIKLCNNGSIQSAASAWTHTGDFVVTGKVADQVGSLADLRGHYNEHTHPPDTAEATPQD